MSDDNNESIITSGDYEIPVSNIDLVTVILRVLEEFDEPLTPEAISVALFQRFKESLRMVIKAHCQDLAVRFPHRVQESNGAYGKPRGVSDEKGH